MLRRGPTQDPRDIIEYFRLVEKHNELGKSIGSSDSVWYRDDAFSKGGIILEGINYRGVQFYGEDGECLLSTATDEQIFMILFHYYENTAVKRVLWVRPDHEPLLVAVPHDGRLFELRVGTLQRVNNS